MQRPHGSMGNLVHALLIGGDVGLIQDAASTMIGVSGSIVDGCALQIVNMAKLVCVGLQVWHYLAHRMYVCM